MKRVCIVSDGGFQDIREALILLSRPFTWTTKYTTAVTYTCGRHHFELQLMKISPIPKQHCNKTSTLQQTTNSATFGQFNILSNNLFAAVWDIVWDIVGNTIGYSEKHTTEKIE